MFEETEVKDPNDTSFVEGLDEGGSGSVAEEKQQPVAAKPEPADWEKAVGRLAEVVEKTHGGKKDESETKRQPTQDEINEFWGVYNPEKQNPEFFRKWLRVPSDMDPEEAKVLIEERKALFAEMQQGLMRQAVTAQRNLMAAEIQKLREEFKPVQETVAQSRQENLRNEFNKSYPVLADPKFKDMLRLEQEALQTREFPEGFKQYSKALAEGVAKRFEALTSQKLDLGAVPTKKTTATSPRLPRTSVGGTGGSGGGRREIIVGTSGDDSDSLDWMKDPS